MTTWSDQFSSVTRSCPTLCNPMYCSMPGFPVHHQLLELIQTHVHRVSDAIQPSHPLSSPYHLQSFPASGSFPMSWLFTSGGQSIGASAPVLPVNIQSWFLLGLTGLDLPAVQGTLKSLQHCSSKASILWRSAFPLVELSHPSTKTIALTIGTFVYKVMYSKSHQSLAIREAKTYRVYSVLISHVFSSSCSITVSQDRDNWTFFSWV